jgi:predicted flap endonuclease-1-like 5' DNA nuclease
VAGVTPEIAKVLEDAGVKTVAYLNTVTPEHIMEVSHASGVAMDAGRAARIATMGRVLGRFG